jgi:hypothetical protein
MRTSAPHIFAVGDVTGYYPLVHVAIYQGELAARNAIRQRGVRRSRLHAASTHTIFTDPQVAVVGRSEKELAAAGIPYLVGSYPFSEHGKAIAINKTKGFVKMMAAPDDGRILGAAVVGPEASDLIHEVIVAMYYGGTVASSRRFRTCIRRSRRSGRIRPRTSSLRSRRTPSRRRAASRSDDDDVLKLAIVQTKPRKGDVEANLAELGADLRATRGGARAVRSHRLARSRRSRAIFLKAACTNSRSSARRARRARRGALARGRRLRARAGRHRARLLRERGRHVLQFVALRSRSARAISVSSTCIARCSCRRTACSTRSAFSRGAGACKRSIRASGAWRS